MWGWWRGDSARLGQRAILQAAVVWAAVACRAVACTVVACALVSCLPLPASAQVDLSPLFSPPAAAEIAAVQAEWAGRALSREGWTVEETGQVSGFTVWVVSQVLDGNLHYGAIRLPRDFTPGASFPVLLLNHGGTYGFSLDFLLTWDEEFPGSCLQDSFFVVAPTYRGEGFNGNGQMGSYNSQGQKERFDWDADDALALLDGVLAHLPEADPNRIVVHGGSRGGNVAYHLALRDPRVRAAAILFGPADFFLPYFQQDAEAVVNDGAPAQNTLLAQVMDEVVGPYLAGSLGLGEARLTLLRWSVPYFLHPGLRLQLHHGTYDNTVPIAHSQSVAAVMDSLGVGPPDFEFFTYPGGHNTSGVSGYELREEDFLCPMLGQTVGVGPGAGGPGADDPGPVDPGQSPALRLFLASRPNPFPARTELVFAVEAVALPDAAAGQFGSGGGGSVVELQIFNLAGRPVRTLVRGRLDQGQHRRLWDGRDDQGRRTPAGIYLARLQVGEEAVTRKLVRLR